MLRAVDAQLQSKVASGVIPRPPMEPAIKASLTLFGATVWGMSAVSHDRSKESAALQVIQFVYSNAENTACGKTKYRPYKTNTCAENHVISYFHAARG